MKKKVKVESKEIDTIEFLSAMDELAENNGINKKTLMESIEQALLVAYKKNFDCVDENIKVVIDRTDGKMHVFQQKEVVEEVEDDRSQISLEDAKKKDSSFKLIPSALSINILR